MVKFRDDFYADIRKERRFSSFVDHSMTATDDGATHQREHSDESVIDKAFIRVFDGKTWYLSSTDATDRLQEELDKLYAMAEPNTDIKNDPVVKKFEVNTDRLIKYEANDVEKVPLEKKKSFISKRAEFLKGSEYLTSAGFEYVDRRSVFEFASSLGASLVYDIQWVQVTSHLKLEYGMSNFTNVLRVHETSFPAVKISKDMLTEFKDQAEEFLMKSKSVRKGEYPVILSPEAAGFFMHAVLGTKSASPTAENSKKLTAADFSVYDCGMIEGRGYCPYDDEGTKARRTYLLKDGYLVGRLHTASTAAAAGENVTGNARSVNCDHSPTVMMTNMLIEGGNADRDSLISGVEKGYYVESFYGGNLNGDRFSLQPARAYLIEDGEMTAPARISEVSGKTSELLASIDGVAPDGKVYGGGCDKGVQKGFGLGLGGAYLRLTATVQ